MIAYGIRIAVRSTGRRVRSALFITMARAKPSTSSTATVTTVMKAVASTASHQSCR